MAAQGVDTYETRWAALEATRKARLNLLEREALVQDRELMWGGRYSQFPQGYYDGDVFPESTFPSMTGGGDRHSLHLLATRAKGNLPAGVFDNLWSTVNNNGKNPPVIGKRFDGHPMVRLIPGRS